MIPKQRPRSLLAARTLFIVGCSALVFVVMAIVREAQRRSAVTSEIRAMEAEIATLAQQRARLSDLLKETETPEFLEREARLRLGLQKPGETVLIVPEGAASAPSQGSLSSQPPKSNVTKWWQRLFR